MVYCDFSGPLAKVLTDGGLKKRIIFQKNFDKTCKLMVVASL